MPRKNSILGKHVIQNAHGWLIHTPAKLNLFFELLRKREDGYHEIESLMVPISLYDTLVLERDHDSLEPFRLECRTFPPSRRPGELIPDDEQNLVWRAVMAVRQIRELPPDLRITLLKRIPSQAGLGGGSSDAAATLLLLDQALELQLNVVEMNELAGKLGSDVPFFLEVCPQIARGRGEILVPMAGLSRLHCVVIVPPTGLSTPAVYSRSQIPRQPKSLKPLLKALQSGEGRLDGLLWNALEPAAIELSEDLVRLAASVAETECLGQLMSGSGSSYFGIYGSARAAARAARHFQGLGLGQVFHVSTVS